MTRLDEYNADEWFTACRKLIHGLTREEFDQMWAEFQTKKAEGRFERAEQ